MYTERTLLISGSEKGLDAIINFLKGCGYAAVSVVSSGDEARRRLQQDTFSLIVLNTPLKDEFGYQLSLQLTQNTCSGVVMLCKADMAEEMTNKTISYGVLVVAKPLNRAALLQAIRMG
ncbi:MAG: response regulator, partial [Ruminococcus sp.]|nr:response regulator [Ruminococcus sp.]